MSYQILVAYATGSGTTTDVAQAIADEIAAAGDGVQVEVSLARDVNSVAPYAGIVLGSSIRLGRWLPDAVDFLDRFAPALRQMPVAFFTTCLTMVNDTAESRRTVLAYMEPVLKRDPEISPVGLGLFAGVLDPLRRMILPPGSGPHGDHRDWDLIRGWARQIAPSLLDNVAQVPDDVVLAQSTLNYANLSGADLQARDISEAELHGATLVDTDLRDADLNQSDLSDADLQRANMEGAALYWADLAEADMREASLTHANLVGADLTDANISGADLYGAVVNGAVLKRAKLVGTRLADADLNWVDCSDADLTGADLRRARLGWANLSGAKLADARLEGALYNEDTKWPDGFDPIAAGCILFRGYT